MKRLPFESTSNVPHLGVFGMLIGFIQVNPSFVERLNCLPPKLFPSASLLQHWYWKPCPELLVLSMVNHCLSPPVAGAMFDQDCPPSNERQRVTKNDCKRLRYRNRPMTSAFNTGSLRKT